MAAKFFKKPALYLCICLCFSQAMLYGQKVAKGNLFIIGGGARSEALMGDLVKVANLRTKDYIIVLPMSSGDPEASFKSVKTELAAYTKNEIGSLNFNAETINNKSWLDSLAGARLIFITGGDQSRFMKVVLNTSVYKAIHQAYENGATVSGTSAGAAVMSKYMITGDQLIGDGKYKETFDKLLDKNIQFEEGLGLLTDVVIDQHFIKRSRFNRLLSALAAHPTFDCIGIDESTAIVVQGKKITVAGESQVLRIANPKKLKIGANGHIKIGSLNFNLYTEGDVFYIK